MDRIEPRIHDEIKDYKEKFYNFTLRQWLFGILVVITTVPTYIFLSPIIGSNLTGWLVIFIALPIGFFGFVPIQGLNAERIIFYWKRNYIDFAKPLLYKTKEEQELEKDKKKSKKKKIKPSINKKGAKTKKRIEALKIKEQRKERKKQREIALAKKKFGINKIDSLNTNFSLSEEEAQVLLKLAKQVVGKENIDEPSEKEGESEEGKKEES